MKKLFLLMGFIVSVLSLNAQTYNSVNEAQSQKSASAFDVSKLTFGGGFGLQLGDYTMINVSPQVGYNFSQKFNAGGGFSYAYYKDSFYSGGKEWDDKRSYLGFNLYGRLYPVNYIVLMVQPEINRMWSTVRQKHSALEYSESKFVPSFLIGGGLRLGPIIAMIQYDVVQDKNSLYGNNIFYSIGYTFGF